MNESPSSKPADFSRWAATARQDVDYHRRQFETHYRSTLRVAEFIQSLVGSTRGQALDVACGAGANIFHLATMMPGFSWAGIDIAGSVLFEVGAPFFKERNLAVDLLEGDFYKLSDYVGNRKFDLVLLMQTLLIVPNYETLLDQLLAATDGWLVVSSLFTDFQVDVNTAVLDYTWPEGVQGPYYYNVYSIKRFRAACEARGCKEFVCRDFEMDLDLPVPAAGGFGTYTRRLDDGSRLQFTGPVFLPWKFVGVRMR